MEDIKQAMRMMASLEEEEKANNPWIQRFHELPDYILDVVRDGSEEYISALTEAILAITNGCYGNIDYKGYKIYYNDTPHVRSISVADGHTEYSYEISFQCDALMAFSFEEYSSEDERKAFLDPENEAFQKTIALLDNVIEYLDDGTWIKKRKKLHIYDFKDYSPDFLKFKHIEWEDRDNMASETLSYLMDDALSRAKGLEFTEEDFMVLADVIRRMVYFADYGIRRDRCFLQGYIWYEWKPKTKRDRFIWRCMDEFGQGDLPDWLINNCTIYYLMDDPKGWEALAYILPITALWEMCTEYNPDSVKNTMFKVFDLIPKGDYVERIEKLIAADRENAEKGGSEDDSESI